MIRKFKGVTLAFVAILAMSAFVASAAQAITITSSSYPQTVTGSASGIGEHFKTEAGSVECKESSYHGVLNEASSVLEVTPTYTGCTAFFGFAAATIHHNGCKYQFTGTEHDPISAIFTAHVAVKCPAGKAIEITAGTCRATVGEAGNGSLTTVDITNMHTASPPDITVKPTVKGITYNVTQDGFGCPFSGTGHRSTGEYTSSGYITVTAPGGLTVIT
jgi:hypothetical protein